MADATVTLSADLSQLRRELAKIPNLSGDAAQSALVKLEKAVVSAEKAAKRSTTAIKRQAAQQAREYEQSLGKIRTGSEKVFGGIVGDVLDVGSALGALGPVAGAAAGSLLAVAGAAVGIGAATAAVVGLVGAADDLLDDLRGINAIGFVSPTQVADIEAANEAMDEVSKVTKQTAVLLAAEFAPAVRDASLALLGLTVVLRDNFDAAASVTESTIWSMATTAFPKLTLAAKALGVGMDDASGGLKDLGQAEVDAQRAADDYVNSLEELKDARDEINARADEQANKTRTVAAAKREAAAATDVFADSLSFEALAIGIELERLGALEEAHAQIAIQRTEAMAQLEQMATEGPALAAQVTQAGRDIVSGLVVAMADSFEKLAGGLAGGVSDLAGALAESGQLSQEAARKAYRVSQAAALAQIGIMTAAGVARQFADLPFPAALITSIGIAATGAAQAIQVANTPPPQFFAGGMVTAAPDAIPAVLHSGEVVQTAASVRRETGGDVRSRNSGASQAPATYIQNIVDGRVVSQVIGNEAKRPGSTVRATVGTGIYGQRRRY